MSKYLPLCDYMSSKAGGPKELWTIFNTMAACFFGAATHIGLAIAYPETANLPTESHISIIGMYAAGLGAGLAIALSDFILPPILRKKGIGLSRGGRIVRASQLAAMSTPVAISLAAHFAYATMTEPTNENSFKGRAPIESVISQPTLR